MYRVAALVLLLNLAAAAQRGSRSNFPSVNQSITVQIRITTENDRPVLDHARIQLLTSGAIPVSETFANDGMAQISGVRPGTYMLRVSGIDIEETTTPTFEITQSENTSMQYVRVKMKKPAGADASGSGGNPTVSAYELNVPPKARQEYEKGDDAMRRSDWKKAAAHLDKAVALYPQYASAYNNRGAVAVKMNDIPAAKAAFQKAVEFNEPTGISYLNLSRLYLADRNFEQASGYATKSLALNPRNPETLTILANCQVATGRYPEAIANARRVHGMQHDRFAVAHVIAALAFEKENDPKSAAAEYEQFLKEDPNNPRAPAARKALERLTAQGQPGGAAPRDRKSVV